MATKLRPPVPYDPNQIRIHGYDFEIKFNGPLEHLTQLAQDAQELNLRVELTANPEAGPEMKVRAYDSLHESRTAQELLEAFKRLLELPDPTT